MSACSAHYVRSKVVFIVLGGLLPVKSAMAQSLSSSSTSDIKYSESKSVLTDEDVVLSKLAINSVNLFTAEYFDV